MITKRRVIKMRPRPFLVSYDKTERIMTLIQSGNVRVFFSNISVITQRCYTTQVPYVFTRVFYILARD